MLSQFPAYVFVKKLLPTGQAVIFAALFTLFWKVLTTDSFLSKSTDHWMTLNLLFQTNPNTCHRRGLQVTLICPSIASGIVINLFIVVFAMQYDVNDCLYRLSIRNWLRTSFGLFDAINFCTGFLLNYHCWNFDRALREDIPSFV